MMRRLVFAALACCGKPSTEVEFKKFQACAKTASQDACKACCTGANAPASLWSTGSGCQCGVPK